MDLHNEKGCADFNIEIDCYIYSHDDDQNITNLRELLESEYDSVEIYVPVELFNKTLIYNTYDELSQKGEIVGTVWSGYDTEEDIREHFLDYHTPYIQNNEKRRYIIGIPEEMSDIQDSLLKSILKRAKEESIYLLAMNIARCELDAPYQYKEEQLYKAAGIKVCETFEDYDKVDDVYRKKEDAIYSKLDTLRSQNNFEGEVQKKIEKLQLKTFDELIKLFKNRVTISDYRSGKLKMPF